MRILIMGGTGFIGPQVALNLLESGHEVNLFHRGKTEAQLPEEIRHIYGNRKYLDNYSSDLKRLSPDVVLDMIALCEQDTKAAIRVFKGTAGRLVTVSSQDVYRAYGKVIRIEPGPYEPVPIREDSLLRTKLYPYRDEVPRDTQDPHRYLDDYDKIPIEKTTMGEPELPGTVVRLPMVYGQRDSQHRLFNYLRRMDDQRPAILLDSGIATWRATRGYVENVGAAIASAVMNQHAAGRIYNAGDKEDFTMAEWVRRIGQAAGWPGEIAVLPRENLPTELTADMDTNQDLVADTSRIREELGYEDPVGVDEALARTVAWERQYPPASIDPRIFDYATEDEVLATLRP
jgi:nucleoside-diphosphate-sugar epimerase